jgi:type IV pilus assembly protein PilM
MAEKIGSVWAIDIGNTSLKALRLSNESGTLQVIGFDHIQHGKILTGTGVKDQEKQELVAISLRQFVLQNDVSKDEIIVSVPSQNSFVRFVNLPPVESKRIPEIVKFEASQQIPFDINEVAWDWQLMTEEGAAEAKVGIFAIKNDAVSAELEHFSRENMEVSYVQVAPMALYNFLVYDRPDLTKSETQATVVLNIGAENTDLVVCTKSNVWQRTIPMGGNAFTRAIAETFKLNFEKAEKLKRTAPMSKYARQILQAMKPVFSDLASEVQRSLGFYSSANPNAKLARILALGGGTKMRGLLQYLQQSLSMPIERLDSFKNLGVDTSVSVAKFHESVCDFGIVYGLGVQALGLGRIECNLLPSTMARSMAWAQKTKYFVAAACLLLIVSVLALARQIIDRTSYQSKAQVRDKIKTIINEAQKVESDLQEQSARGGAFEQLIKKEFDLFKYREILPLVNQTILRVMPNIENNPAQVSLYDSFNRGDVQAVKETSREQRKQIFITGMSVFYSLDLTTAKFGSAAFDRAGEGRPGGGRKDGGMDAEEYMRMMSGGRMGGRGGARGRGATQRQGRPAAGTPVDTEQKGFVVTIAGYSPYFEIQELFDPPGAKNDPNKWGVVNRLINLDRIFDGNSPFELYDRTNKENFELKTGEVDLASEMPVGIGLRKAAETADATDILIDPMTKEVISKVEVVDEQGRKVKDRMGNPVYKTNDHWFVLNLKLKWKDAPAAATEAKAAVIAAPEPPPEEPAPAPAPKGRTKPERKERITAPEL